MSAQLRRLAPHQSSISFTCGKSCMILPSMPSMRWRKALRCSGVSSIQPSLLPAFQVSCAFWSAARANSSISGCSARASLTSVCCGRLRQRIEPALAHHADASDEEVLRVGVILGQLVELEIGDRRQRRLHAVTTPCCAACSASTMPIGTPLEPNALIIACSIGVALMRIFLPLRSSGECSGVRSAMPTGP